MQREALLAQKRLTRSQKAVNERLRACGITDEDLERVYTPIGLNLGGGTPAEIAVAIAAEMIMVRAQKKKGVKFACPV